MRYSAVFFDWGDTLSPLDANKVPILQTWVPEMLRDLYHASYRLAIISNTHRYQDAQWIRNELAKRNVLQLFEVVVSSATYAIHKPDLRLFQKALEFMQIRPRNVLMIGDSAHADGACQYLGCGFLQVTPGENWAGRLSDKLHDPPDLRARRKLTPLYDYNLTDRGTVITKLRHLSEPLAVGDRFLIDQAEYRVTTIPRALTKQDVLTHGEDFIEIGVQPLDRT